MFLVSTLSRAVALINTAVRYGEVHDSKLLLSSPEYKQLQEPLSYIKTRVAVIIEFCESLGYDSESIGFDVKMPSGLSLSEFAHCAKDLNTVLSQCSYLNVKDERIEFQSVDVGSQWLTFFIAGATTYAILTRLAAVVDRVLVLRSHKITCDQQAEELRRLKLSNDFVEDMLTKQKTIADALLEDACENLNKQFSDGNDIDNEQQERNKHALELLLSWMNQGMEIYCSIGAPSEIKALFPTLEPSKISSGATKLLTHKNTQDRNESSD